MSVGTNEVGTKRGNGKICLNCGNEGHSLVVTGIVQPTGEDVRKVEKYGHFACCCKGGRKMWVQTFKTQQAEGKAAFNT